MLEHFLLNSLEALRTAYQNVLYSLVSSLLPKKEYAEVLFKHVINNLQLMLNFSREGGFGGTTNSAQQKQLWATTKAEIRFLSSQFTCNFKIAC